MKNIVGRRTKPCLQLTEIPVSTSSTDSITSPTTSLKETHYYKNMGSRNQRRINKVNMVSTPNKGGTIQKYELIDDMSGTATLTKDHLGNIVRPKKLVDNGTRKERRAHLQKHPITSDNGV